MKLTEILDLHPGAEADSAALGRALAVALAKRDELLGEVAAAEQERRAGLLTADEKALTAIEKTASTARLAVDRVEAILPQLRADLVVAQGRETVTELQAEAAKVDGLIGNVERWQQEDFPRVAELIGAGLHAEREAIDAYGALLGRIDVEFASQAVRDAAPAGVQVKAPGGHRPSHLFPTWQLPAHG